MTQTLQRPVESLYDSDFYAWTQNQADLLRQGDFRRLDLDNLIEEIEDMGKSQQRQLESRLVVLIAHLLKWQFQPDKRSRSWQATIRIQRIRLHKLLRENPSLRAQLDQVIIEAYEVAVEAAWGETGLDSTVFPTTCPYTAEQILDADFLPEAAE
ncbi:MAG: DUF29 domain-containing protein [Chloroflexi bacterium]|nr:MAG: DUF29 domain-containing protein [Chloroflexota bacterium]